MRVALKNAGISLPPVCINVNLSPADVRKEGTMFDLPVAVGILMSLGHLKREAAVGTVLLGELGLNGEIKPVRGVLPCRRRRRVASEGAFCPAITHGRGPW